MFLVFPVFHLVSLIQFSSIISYFMHFSFFLSCILHCHSWMSIVCKCCCMLVRAFAYVFALVCVSMLVCESVCACVCGCGCVRVIILPEVHQLWFFSHTFTDNSVSRCVWTFKKLLAVHFAPWCFCLPYTQWTTKFSNTNINIGKGGQHGIVVSILASRPSYPGFELQP